MRDPRQCLYLHGGSPKFQSGTWKLGMVTPLTILEEAGGLLKFRLGGGAKLHSEFQASLGSRVRAEEPASPAQVAFCGFAYVVVSLPLEARLIQ